jgi:hypothetical protein
MASGVRSSSPGWLALPPLRPPQWWLPRQPRAAACTGLKVHQPLRALAQAAWSTTRLAARLGGLRLLAGGQPPPDEVLDLVAPHLRAGDLTAVMRRGDEHRFVVLIMSQAGWPWGVAKVALSVAGERALRQEAGAIAAYGGWLTPPLSAPRVLASEPGLLLLDAVDWRMRRRPWRLTSGIAAALGTLHRKGGSGDGQGLAHGDFAPWNLLRHETGWVLLDWEHAGPGAPAYFDLLHFLVQSSRQLGRPSRGAVVRGVSTGRGWTGRAVRAYAGAAGLDSATAVGHLRAYLWAREAGIDLRTQRGRTLLLAGGPRAAHPLEGP